VVGTIINAAAILAGGTAGLTITRQPSIEYQRTVKGLMGVLIVYVGLKLTFFDSLHGTLGHRLRELGVVIVALMLGRLLGSLLHLQKGVNRLGALAQEKFSRADAASPSRTGEGFITCTLLFCVGPMAIIGALQDGLENKWETLAIKAVMDGFTTMAFVPTFGWGVMLSVIPLVAYQGTITLAAGLLSPYLRDQMLLDSVNATGGLLVFSIALVVLDLKKIQLADYLPSLAVAPLLTAWWR
jgi:uncharacterized membrane protein YqgA involved in biofilm formation